MDLLLKKSFPKFNTKLPSGKKVSFRPFIVREENSLLIAKQTDNEKNILSTLIDVMSDCFGEDVSKYSIADFEFAFLYLRGKSVGEVEKATIKCPHTKEQVKVIVDCINDIQIKGEKQSNIVSLDNCKLKLSPLTITNILENVNYNKSFEDKLNFIAYNIIEIHQKEEILRGDEISLQDKISFLENLTSKEFKKIMNYYDNNQKVYFVLEYQNSKKELQKIELSGVLNIISFFLTI